MLVKVKVYDRSKYDRESKKVAEIEHEIMNMEVKEIAKEEILKEFDCTDEHNEYLILTLANGITSTFRNSRVDVFRA